MNHTLNQCLRLTSAFVLFVLFALPTHAQQGTLQFVKGGGGGGFIGSNSTNPDPDEIYTTAIDKDDNLIVGGATTFTPRFDSIYFGYMVGNQYNGDNGFIAKYNSCGEVQWVSVIYGRQSEWVTGLDVDEQGNIYILAMVHVGSTQLDSAVIVTPHGNTVFRNSEMIFAKYSPDGHLLHLKIYTGVSGSMSESFYPQQGFFKRLRNNTFLMTVYTSGFSNTVHIDNYATPVKSNNFLLLDSLGNVLKGAIIDTTVGNSNVSNLLISNFVLDNNENIYFNVINYDFDSLKLLDTYFNPAQQYTSYLIKTDTSFRIKKHKTAYFNGVLSKLFIHGDKLYACERVNDGAIFDWDTFHHADMYFNEYRVYRIDTGLDLKWVSKPQYQSNSATWTYLNGAATEDNVYLGFQTRGTVNWGAFQRTTPVNTYDLAVLRLRASDGVCVEGKLLQGNITSRDAISIIKPEPQGGAYFIGTYAGSIGIPGYDTVYSNGSIASPDYFIVKWGLPCTDTLGTLDAPAPPINLVATATGTSSIGINWNDVSQGETGFNLYRSPNGIDSWSMVATTAANTPLYSNTGLQPNTTYWYRATSFNQNSESAYSNIDSATTWPATCGTAIGHTNTDSLYTFTATNTGTAPYTYAWSLNGNSSTAPSLTAVLDTAGSYYVCLTVTDSYGCTATACDTVLVTPATCATSLSYTHVGNTYSFSTVNTGTAPYIYYWSDNGDVFAMGDTLHTQLAPGTHNICVTVTDVDGCTATGCQSISIDSCNISIHYTDSGYWYTFYTTNGGVAPFQYQWQSGSSIFSFQDTTTSALLPGLNTICVKVTDANGCVAWACEEITVGTDTCNATISYTNTGNSYAFTASSTGTAPYTYKWRNNGGSVFGTAQNASIDLQSGSNNVCVTVTDANNCSATACQQVIISGIAEDVQAGFNVYPNPLSDAVHIAIDATQAGVIELTITDLQGRLMASETRQVIPGSNLLAYSTAQWAAGVYQVRIQYGTQHYTAKLIKM